jgi:hypothetical protein
MNSNIKQHSLKELKKDYQSVKAPNWLRQDTLQKAELQKNTNLYDWMTPIFMSVVLLTLVLIFMFQQPEVTHPSLKSPSLADLNINQVMPEHFYLPSTSDIGRLPTIPKTPTMPKRSEQTSEITKQHSISISNAYLYKEVNLYV